MTDSTPHVITPEEALDWSAEDDDCLSDLLREVSAFIRHNISTDTTDVGWFKPNKAYRLIVREKALLRLRQDWNIRLNDDRGWFIERPFKSSPPNPYEKESRELLRPSESPLLRSCS